jgi:IS30 family transposase
VLLRESLSNENTPFAKLVRIAKNNRSSAVRPAFPEVNGIVAERYRMNRKLTHADRAKLAEEYRSGMSALKLSRKYNVHRQTIARQLKREGVELRVQLKRTLMLTEQAKDLYAEGRSLADVATLLGVEASTVGRALKRAGVKLRPPGADRWSKSRDKRI